jgi:branched-subunit amino acid aminotransferase/4-amino-4-deoxychorismate lyase
MFNELGSKKILDTFKFENSKIFLKDLHIQRSFEAAQILNRETQHSEVSAIYNRLEVELMPNVMHSQMVRLLLTADLQPEVQIIDQIVWPSEVCLQLMTDAQQPNGLGPQNYKWSQRDY